MENIIYAFIYLGIGFGVTIHAGRVYLEKEKKELSATVCWVIIFFWPPIVIGDLFAKLLKWIC